MAHTGAVTVRIGFLGCGLIARTHARRLADVPDADIVAGFDPDAGRARVFAADHGSDVASSEAEVIERSDAVYVATWTAEHPRLVEAVVAAGKPVFCEKPLAVDLAAASAMVETVEAAGVVNQVGLVLRRSPGFRWLRHQVQSGALGAPMSLLFRDDQYLPTQGRYDSSWRGDVSLAGSGTLLEHSIHDLDLIDWIIGPVTEVSARTAHHHGIGGIEDQATILLETAGGAHAVLSSTWHDLLARPGNRYVEVFGRHGFAAVEGDWFGPIREQTGHDVVERQGEEVVELAEGIDGRGINPDADFVESVRIGSGAYPDFRVALRAHVLADAAYRSAAQGGTPVAVEAAG